MSASAVQNSQEIEQKMGGAKVVMTANRGVDLFNNYEALLCKNLGALTSCCKFKPHDKSLENAMKNPTTPYPTAHAPRVNN